MSKKLHFLATHYGDYRLDYERFFADNIQLLEKSGVAYPWLERDNMGIRWQINISQKLKDLETGNDNILRELKNTLEGRNRLLFAAPLGVMLAIMPPMLKFIKTHLSDWENAETNFVWLACERAMEIEGAIRYNLPLNTCENQYEKSLTNAPKLLGDLEKCLILADKVKILPDTRKFHIPEKELLAAIDLHWSPRDIVPMRQTERESRETLYLGTLMKKAFPDFTPASRLDSSDSDLTMLEPARLQDIYKAVSLPMTSLAKRYGVDLRFPEPEGNPAWMPLREPSPAALRQSVKNWLAERPKAERDYNLRLMENTPGLEWLDDAKSYIRELRGLFNISEPASPLLSVLTLTKNQEKYIGECIESVLAQKTDFPVRHIILDDCSTDDTPKIIRKYAEKHPSIFPIFLKSHKAYGDNVRGLFSACHSKYAALCDGDDYFIDPRKLQKQVDFLEAHPDCAICFHPVQKRYEDGSPTEIYPPKTLLPGEGKRHIFTLRDLLKANIIQTNSVVYRWRFPSGLPHWFDATLTPSDWYWHILHAETGLIGYLPEEMAVYRRHAASLFATSEKSHVNHRKQFGHAELKLYDVLDRHFRGKYRNDFLCLANGVFADYVKVYMETGDDELLNSGVAAYPVFAQNFLSQLKLVSDANPKANN